MAILLAADFPNETEASRRVAQGSLVRLARGIYSDEVARAPEEIVADNWREIVGRTMPDAVITYASAFTGRPTAGHLYVSHARRDPLVLPGVTVHSDGRKASRSDDDTPLGGGLYSASLSRAIVDNIPGAPGRPLRSVERLSRTQLHDEIARIAATYTRAQQDTLQAQVAARANKAVADTAQVFFEAARGERATVDSDSTAMQSAQRGENYDHARVARFREIAAALRDKAPSNRYVGNPIRTALVPFYEAYFSNYIEGTEFTVEEAEQVVFQHRDLGRPKDAHDVLGTYNIVSDVGEMSRAFDSADDFMETLRDRHALMMGGRPEVNPGMWKTQNNRAGITVFVAHELVQGTLRAGWEICQDLEDPFQRATYMMFMVSEVHPFTDGNGRSARVVMNNELVRAHMHRVIIPTVLRTDYNSSLVRATAGNGPDGLYRVLGHAQRWVQSGDFSNATTGMEYLELTNAMVDSREAERQGLTLEIPRPSVLGGYDLSPSRQSLPTGVGEPPESSGAAPDATSALKGKVT